MAANEQPLQHTPRQRGVEKALDRSITPSFASPARQAPHGHTTRHRQQGLRHHGELTQRRGRETLVETSENRHNIAHGRILLG